jgi:hypothetical protein
VEPQLEFIIQKSESNMKALEGIIRKGKFLPFTIAIIPSFFYHLPSQLFYEQRRSGFGEA